MRNDYFCIQIIAVGGANDHISWLHWISNMASIELPNDSHPRILRNVLHTIERGRCFSQSTLQQTPLWSGWADLNRRPHVPQTCTLNPCATARIALARTYHEWFLCVNKWDFSEYYSFIRSVQWYCVIRDLWKTGDFLNICTNWCNFVRA